MNANVLVLKGPLNVLELLNGEIDLNNDFKQWKRLFRISPTKNLYMVHFSSSIENSRIYNKIRMDLLRLDPKAKINKIEYMGKPDEKVGHWLFIHHYDKNECYAAMEKLVGLANAQ